MDRPESSDTAGLRHSLTRLHTQLSDNPTLDRQLRALLHEVLGDIERLLGPNSAATAAAPAPSPQPAPARSRLEALAASFDAEHPTLSASVRELVDLLGRAGL